MKKINENCLIVLKKDKNNLISIDFENILNTIESKQSEFLIFFKNKENSLKELMEYVRKNITISELYTVHNYCEDLIGIYQIKQFFQQNIINEIKNIIILFEINDNSNSIESEKVQMIFNKIEEEYKTCFKSHIIRQTYKKCKDDDDIVAYSHRISGWSNPVFNLNENFSLEIKTNFGFGYSSYFYIIIKYKNIEITPFSDWINYEYSNFSEIIRYTKNFTNYNCLIIKNKKIFKPILSNFYWKEVMEFSRDACNLSIVNEEKFIEKFILEECERMVCGLEKILIDEKFFFMDRETNKFYKVNKEGHYLIEYRGEKISGSLKFINKILEFKDFTNVSNCISRLEKCNLKIQPYLINEIDVLLIKIDNLNSELSVIKPQYEEFLKQNNDYRIQFFKMRMQLSKELLENKIKFSEQLYEEKANQLFPEYLDFKIAFLQNKNSFNFLNQTIKNLNIVLSNIKRYNENIKIYFKESRTEIL